MRDAAIAIIGGFALVCGLGGAAVAGTSQAIAGDCSPGSDCWSRRVIADQVYLNQQESMRQLRQTNIDRGRELRSQSYPGYRDDSIPTMRPSGVQIIRPGGQITINPLQQ